MPLLRKKPFVPIDLPPDLKADEEVFLNILTKEIFRDYEEYFRRSILCNSLVWTCESTGRTNLTLSEALQSEADAAEHLQKMPLTLQRGICYIIHKHEVSSLTSFVDEVLAFYRCRFLVGETVEILSTDKTKKAAVVSEITLSAGFSYPKQISYQCQLSQTGETVSVLGDKISRSKSALTRERVKLLAKCSAKKISFDPPLYAVKTEFIEKLHLDDENFTVPYLNDYGKQAPKGNGKRKKRDDEGYDEQEKKRNKKKPDEMGVDSVLMSTEERKRIAEQERAKKRREKQEERENQKKVQSAEAMFNREWAKTREDLELMDSVELPHIAPVLTSLSPHLFGDVLQVVEFFHLFGEHVDLNEGFPDGITIGELERSLICTQRDSIFGDLVIFLLKLIFALQEEEDEEEVKLAERYNCTYTEPSLDVSQVTMLPKVTYQSVMSKSSSQPWLGSAQAYYFSHYYLGIPLHQLQLDSDTVTEVLRLHILGSGGRASGNSFYGRWRFNNRGMFTDLDNPCVELFKRDPNLINTLGISNIFDLPPASKLAILHTFIVQLLSYAQFREIIEEAFEASREAKKEWKSFGAENLRREKEESAQRYKEWIASRIKINKSKKGSEDDENGLADNDISLAAETNEEFPVRTEAEKVEERKLQELQNHTLYVTFREISCKLNVNRLGYDRFFRKYWSFHSVPGIFVEKSDLDIASLYPDENSTHCDVEINGNESEYFINQTDNLPVPNSSLNGDSVMTIIDPASMSVDEMVQLKLREATERLGRAPETYSQLCNTRGFETLKSRHVAWSHLSTEGQIRDFLAGLNLRGEREKELAENINKDLDRIINDLESKPTLMKDIDTETSCTNTGEKLIEASVREQICDLENRIYEANFGAVSVKNRMSWRQEIEEFWTDGKADDSQLSTQSSQDSSQKSCNSSGRQSTITKLSQALLSVEGGVPAKYLTYPLGESNVGHKTEDTRVVCGVSQLDRWRESLENCTSLSQIQLHLTALDCSIMWSKSILKTNCRGCRRKCDPDKMLLCDGCDRGQHIYCLKPKLRSIPAGKWFCSSCRPTSRPHRKRNGSSTEEEEDLEEGSRVTRSRGSPAPKSLSEKLKCCHQIVNILQEDENGWPFLHPVDAEQIPDYYKIIPNPMDLSTIEGNLKSGKYRKVKTFIDDIELIFLNCQHYNQSKAPASRAGVRLKKLFETKLKEFGLS